MDDVSLDEVARPAGVTVQTVIRRFGDKHGLLVAAGDGETERVTQQRAQAPVGNVPAAVRNLVDHYEELGPAGMMSPINQETASVQLDAA